MTENEHYIATLTVNDVPWHRLTTTYGRAAEFPRYFAVLEAMDDLAAVKDALYELTINTEHQSTLWHATPFAMIFLVRIFRRARAAQPENEIARIIAERLLEHFRLIAECVRMGGRWNTPNLCRASPICFGRNISGRRSMTRRRTSCAGRRMMFSPQISSIAFTTTLLRCLLRAGANSNNRHRAV